MKSIVIGIMPQELNIDPFFTPRAALDVQAGLYGVPKAQRRTDEILAMVGLTDKAEAYARTLSGGMRRRLLLGALAIAGIPPKSSTPALTSPPSIRSVEDSDSTLGAGGSGQVREGQRNGDDRQCSDSDEWTLDR